MKTIKNTFKLALISLVIIACNSGGEQSIDAAIESNDLNNIRTMKAQLDAQQIELTKDIQRLEDKIAELDPQTKIPLITTFQASVSKFVHFLELQGSVQTKKNLVIYPEYSGVLTNVYVTEGQKVSKGQTLAKIDDGGLSQQLSQMQIQADLAKTTFERQKRLWDQNIGSEIQYLQAKSSYEAQQQAINSMKQQLGRTVVTAPFSGVIDDVISEQGSVVSPGQVPLFRIVNLSDMYVETDVPERFLPDVTKGKHVQVNFPVLNKTIDTEVRQAGSFINPANRTFKVEIAIPNKNGEIKPNLTARLKINDYSNDSAVLIPLNVISENAAGQQYVYIINDKQDNKGTAKRVIIETGKTQGDYIEVVSGINDGDEIIDEGARAVKDNQQVKILAIEEVETE